MTKDQAAKLIDIMRDLWPSKFNWTQGLMSLWIDTLAKDYYDFRQAEAVIRQHRRDSDNPKPSIRAVTIKLAEVHRQAKQVEAKSEHGVSAETWAEVNRDRDSAAIWWADNKAEAAELVRLACLAYPIFRAAFVRFLDPKFHPTPRQCMTLLAGWQVYHDHGEWTGTGQPGPLAESASSYLGD